MASPPAALPANPSEFHAYAFSNACLRVYTIVSLRDKFKKDASSQMEVSRGLHWEMAALFDHLSACKMFGPVPIPTAVVPMLTHYTNLYAQNPNPTVDIHDFPFEYNEFMTTREPHIQGNKWWDPLLDPASVPVVPQSQPTYQAPPMQPLEPQQANGQAQTALQTTPPEATQQSAPSSNDVTTHATVEQPPDGNSAPPAQPDPTAMSTAANPNAPYLAINQSASFASTTPYAPAHQRAGQSRFIPYQPPAGPHPQAVASAPPAARQAIIAPPVKAPRQRKRTVKTSEFVDEDGRPEAPNGESISQSPTGVQEEQVDKENGVATDAAPSSQAQKKRAQDAVKADDYINPHEGPAACGNCKTHERKCLTSKDTKLKRCLECRLRQARCIWPVSDGASAPTNGSAQAPATTAQQPTNIAPASAVQEHIPPPPADESASTSTSAKERQANRLVAEVVVTPARRPKRKAQEVSGSGEPTSKKSMRLRSSGPVHANVGEAGSPLTSAPSSVAEVDASLGGMSSFEGRLALAQGEEYVRSKLALLVDMARTAEMRLADVLGRVAELEAANRRMEKMITGLQAQKPSTSSPKRK